MHGRVDQPLIYSVRIVELMVTVHTMPQELIIIIAMTGVADTISVQTLRVDVVVIIVMAEIIGVGIAVGDVMMVAVVVQGARTTTTDHTRITTIPNM